MTDPWGIRWEHPDDSSQSFMVSIVGPDKSGWYSALVDLRSVDETLLDTAQGIIEDGGYYRPHGNWDWESINTTYMRKRSTYHQIKLRKKKGDEGNDEEGNDEEE